MTDEDRNAAKVELGCDWPSKAPQILEIGPVLHPHDAVANKVTAVFGCRAAPHDCIDVHAATASHWYSQDRLVNLAKEHDDGFDPHWFAKPWTAAVLA